MDLSGSVIGQVLEKGFKVLLSMEQEHPLSPESGPYRIEVYRFPWTKGANVIVASGPDLDSATADLAEAIESGCLDKVGLQSVT